MSEHIETKENNSTALVDSASVDTLPRFTPDVDLIETADAFVLRADLPGLRKSDLNLNLEDGLLTLEGNVAGWLRRRYFRQFRLGDGLDKDQIEASFDAGVLTVRLPRIAQAKPRKIPVELR